MAGKHPQARKFPVTVTRAADPETWQAALERAGGDHRRLRPEADGKITVLNRPAGQSWSEQVAR